MGIFSENCRRQNHGKLAAMVPRPDWPALSWLVLVSASGALAATVVLFDRTTLSGVSRVWAGSLVFMSIASFVWWTNPGMANGRVHFASYQLASLVPSTLPLVVAGFALVGADYLSDEVHLQLYSSFYYPHLLSDRSWPVSGLAVIALFGCVGWTVRSALLRVEEDRGLTSALGVAMSRLPALFPWGALLLGLLLGTAAMAMINVNYWRYWATADGWASLGHYPFTLTDSNHVLGGGVAPYFISFPLLPALLSLLFPLVGHNTLALYLPLILGNVLLPIAVFLAAREATRNATLSFLVSSLLVTFPLLRRYTLDMPEADVLLMSTLCLAAYFRLRADRPAASARAQAISGLAAGLASLARAEGVLYMVAMNLAAGVKRWRSGSYWLSLLPWILIVAAFSAVALREFGMIWPGNHSGTLSLSNFGSTLAVVQESRLFSAYSSTLGLSEGMLAAILCLLLALIAYAFYRMWLEDFALSYMPAVALANVLMVFFVGPVPAEASKFHDFFRHISYGLPLLAITIAYGLNDLSNRLVGRLGTCLKGLATVGLSLLVVVQLSMLQAPVTPGENTDRPIMTSDVHVTAAELVIDRYELPVMRFQWSGSRYLPNEDAYMADFPDVLNRRYAASDVRLVGNSFEYYLTARNVFLLFLVMCLPSLVFVRRSPVLRPDTRPGS